MWKTLPCRAALFLIGFVFIWYVVSPLLPLFITISPTVGIVLFESCFWQTAVKLFLSLLGGTVGALLPDVFLPKQNIN